MNTIDQRILIPGASPQLVWEFLSDLSQINRWMADCTSISFLSTTHNGVGTRLRLNAERGRDRVFDIIAWYNGLGYEYIIVEGTNLRENRGRIRLQDQPEGTVVQWTFSYETGGMLAKLSNPGRTIEEQMETSLKALYKHIVQLSKDKRHEAKSLMRDDPGVEARAQYRPRHSSAARTEMQPDERIFEPGPVVPLVRTAPPASSVVLPPPDEGDTRPNPASVSAVSAFAPPPELFAGDFDFDSPLFSDEPDFLTQLDEQPQADPHQDRLFERAFQPPTLEAPAVSVPAWAVQVEPPARPQAAVPEPPAPAANMPAATMPAPEAVSSHRSVFDIFGVPRPSETGVMAAVTPAQESALADEHPVADHAAYEAASDPSVVHEMPVIELVPDLASDAIAQDTAFNFPDLATDAAADEALASGAIEAALSLPSAVVEAIEVQAAPMAEELQPPEMPLTAASREAPARVKMPPVDAGNIPMVVPTPRYLQPSTPEHDLNPVVIELPEPLYPGMGLRARMRQLVIRQRR